MLHRRDQHGLTLISQPAHAWISGQIARAWGGPGFGAFGPDAEMLLAAEQHDVGWTAWERQPTLNPETGLPHAFLELNTRVHVAIWSDAAARVAAQSLYAALLVSLHGTGLYERHHDSRRARGYDAAAAHRFLSQQRRLQESFVARLQRSKAWRPWLCPAAIERNRALLAAWDRLSLLLCMGFEGAARVPDVPGVGRRRGTLELQTLDAAPKTGLRASGEAAVVAAGCDLDAHYRIRPWPFATGSVLLIVEGHRLDAGARFRSEAAMRRALTHEAAPVRLGLHLTP